MGAKTEEELKMTVSSKARLGSVTGSFALMNVGKGLQHKRGKEETFQPLQAAVKVLALGDNDRGCWDTARQKCKLLNRKCELLWLQTGKDEETEPNP